MNWCVRMYMDRVRYDEHLRALGVAWDSTNIDRYSDAIRGIIGHAIYEGWPIL